MKRLKVIGYNNTNSLLSAILFLIIGAVLFFNPGGIVKFISYIIGSLLMICGIIKLLDYFRISKKLNIQNNTSLISGIILVIIGIISIICAGVIESAIRFIIGGWILYSGILRLIPALKSNNIPSIVTSGIMIFCGLYIILKSNLVFSIIGLFIMIYAIMEIIGFIFNNKR